MRQAVHLLEPHLLLQFFNPHLQVENARSQLFGSFPELGTFSVDLVDSSLIIGLHWANIVVKTYYLLIELAFQAVESFVD
jgi:hypothetical protein